MYDPTAEDAAQPTQQTVRVAFTNSDGGQLAMLIWTPDWRNPADTLAVRLDRFHKSEEESSYSSYYHVSKQDGRLDADLTEQIIKAGFPSQHCQHEYDCCGGYYRQSPIVLYRHWANFESEIAMVILTYNCNI